jgi:DNA-binding MarR family transcriptional regulator
MGVRDTAADREEVLRELFGLAPQLERFRAEGMARRGLSQPRARLLRRLDEHGSQVMSELSRALDVTPRAVTALVDGLEAGGLVRRCEHPRDRRATVVELTASGRRTCREMREGHARLSEELLGGFSERELDVSLRVVRAVRSAMEGRRA